MNLPDTKDTILDISSERPWLLLLFALCACLLGTGLWAIWQAATHDGKPDYCYVDGEFGHLRLNSHRPWGNDKVVYSAAAGKPDAEAIDELLAAAKKIGCPVK